MHSLTVLTSFLALLNLPLSAMAARVDFCPHGSTNTSSSLAKKIATGWYPSWLGDKLGPDDIPWREYNSLSFAFAATTVDSSVLFLNSTTAAMLSTFVSKAHANGVFASLTIGGWGGSQYFSTAVASENRTTFVKAVVDIANKYRLDGIDFDWEYPGVQGIGCNTISANDSENFLAFLQDLRADPRGSKMRLSAAVGLTPFASDNGSPLRDVSAFATVLDYVIIMNYDVWGSWSPSVGPNSPLNDTCASVQVGSAVSALNAWKAAKFPPSKIVLGVAGYGHSFYVNTSNALDSSGSLVPYPSFEKSKQPLGDSDVPGSAAALDECGKAIGISGTFNFNSMIADGFLDATGAAAHGMDYRFDNCSKTPYVYNPKSHVMISYDDAAGFADKGKFIKDNDLAGFALWQITADSNNILVSAIRDAMAT